MHLSVVLLLCLPLASGWWVGLKRLTYDEARAACSPGDLAIFSSNQELSELLQTNQRLRSALASTNPTFFWVGLEKPKDQCVVPGLNLRGFWFVDGTQDSELSVWREEPPDTCTNVRCGAVSLDSGSWGLVSRSCKNRKHFICGPAESGPRPESTHESSPGTGPETRPESTPESGTAGTREPDGEKTRLVPSFVPEPGLGPEGSPEPGPTSGFTHEHGPDQTGPTFGPEPGPVLTAEPLPDRDPRPHPSPDPESSQVPGQTPASAAPSPGSAPSSGPGSDPSPGSGSAPSSGPGSAPSSSPSCVLPDVLGSRFLSQDDPEPGWFTVECWSGEVLLLRCDGGVWTRSGPDSEPDPDPSPDSGPGLNQSDARPGGRSGALRCMDCGPGFKGGEGGECEDIDECSLSPAPCAHGCVNAHGSFTCTPALLSNALVHSLIAVAAVTLAVIAVVTVWCCLRRKRRRSHKPEQDLNQNQTEA